jgi:phosphotransacetylase/acyl dehydratase
MLIKNRPFDTIRIGDSAELTRLCTEDALLIFAAATGNHNPMHLPDQDVDGDGRPEAIASGIFVAATISAVLGNLLPGPGTLYRSQTLNFHRSARAGDELRARVTVTGLEPDGTVTLAAEVARLGDDALILSGEARVAAPRRAISFDDSEVPGLVVQRHRHFEALLKRAEPLPALITAVVCPDEVEALQGALLARQHSIIAPILVGEGARIAKAAARCGADISGIELVEAVGEAAAAQAAVDLVNAGRAQAVMKGHVHTEALLHPMLDRERGLRTGLRLTHVFVMDVPGLAHPLLVTDAAINIAPDLSTKMDIVQNAIDLAISIGIAVPRVAVLSAVETVNPAIPSSIDAALLSKMAERGQIKGGSVDGPLAMDNAVNLAAARGKGLTGAVAGRAEVLVVPDIDAGNMLAKLLIHLAHAEAAGVVLGAKVPVILSSRADSVMARLASAAVAAIHFHAR